MKVIITQRIPDAGPRALAAAGIDVQTLDGEGVRSAGELAAALREADAVITMLSDRVDEALLAACPRLRVVANYAVGTNNIDIAAASRAGVIVTNTPDVLTEATADLAWALLLAVARRVREGEDLVRAREWKGWGPLQLLGHSVAGKTLGIVGAGRIGQATGRRGVGFGMRVLYWGRSRKLDFERTCGAQFAELDTLIRESDYLSLHCPLTDDTRHLIGRAQLATMKPTAILINTARGPVVDEEALAEALHAKRIGGAGLDVYEREPVIHEKLFSAPNTVLLPHLGSATTETRDAMAELCARNIVAALRGEKPPTALNLSELKPRA